MRLIDIAVYKHVVEETSNLDTPLKNYSYFIVEENSNDFYVPSENMINLEVNKMCTEIHVVINDNQEVHSSITYEM